MSSDAVGCRGGRRIVPRSPRQTGSAAWLKTIHHRGDAAASALRAAARSWLALLWFAAALPACSFAAEAPAEALRQKIETLRASGDARIGAQSAAARATLASLYEQRSFAPLWTDSQRVRSLLAAIESSTTHGLDPRDYHAEILPGDARDDSAERDLLLTDAFMRLAFHLYFGKADPRSLQQGWNFARTLDGADPVEALAKLLAAPDPAAALASLAPRLPRYRDLRGALAALREIERRGGWQRIAGGPNLEAGSQDPRVPALRARLAMSGDLAGAGGATEYDAETEYDADLETAVRRFQARHGLEVDGVVGRATLAAMNVPVAARIAQVRANLERLRWVARDLAGEYLLVDIAGFAVELWRDDRLTWSTRAVVGRPFRTTPEFRAPMKYLVLNPEWNVPPTVLREDVLPSVLRSPAYLDRHAMRLVDAAGRTVDAAAVDWPRYRGNPRAFPYQVVQGPGGDNPLGSIKFMFPNEHSVYLHDTPSHALFERPVRAASSGCIRIERPLELARLLLDDSEHWSVPQLQEAIASGRTLTIPVQRAVPVLLLYFTALADADGQPQFRPDLYGRDQPTLRALAAPFRFGSVDGARRRAPGQQ